MISDAYVLVECDNCPTCEEFELTATTRESWDERHLVDELVNNGWVVDEDLTFCCEECCTEYFS
jgi:hypothetical protein